MALPDTGVLLNCLFSTEHQHQSLRERPAWSNTKMQLFNVRNCCFFFFFLICLIIQFYFNLYSKLLFSIMYNMFHCCVYQILILYMGFPSGTNGKESAGHCRRHRAVGSIPESGRSPGGGQVNPLQYSCLENPMDKGAWWDKAHRVAKSRTLSGSI